MPINNFLRGVLQGDSHFDRIALVEIISLLLSIILTIYMLLNDYGILSLCSKYLIESMCIFIAYFLIFKIRPGFNLSFSSNEVHHLFKYSLGLSLSRLFSSVSSNISTLFIGYIFAIKYVAYFSYSLTLTKIPDNLFRTMITNPALTYLGRHKGDVLFEKCQLLASAILFFAMIPATLLALNGDEILVILMGSQWLEFSTMFKIMGFFAISQVIKGWLTILYINFMDMNQWSKITFIELNLIAFLIFITFIFNFSIENFVYCFSFMMLFFWIIVFIISSLKFSPKRTKLLQQLEDFKLILIPFITISCLSYANFGQGSFINTAIYIFLITLIYSICTLCFDRSSIFKLKLFLNDLISE